MRCRAAREVQVARQHDNHAKGPRLHGRGEPAQGPSALRECLTHVCTILAPAQRHLPQLSVWRRTEQGCSPRNGRKERRIVLHAAASDSRILQAGSRHSRLGTAVSRNTGAESLGHIAHCGIAYMRAARAEAAAGDSKPMHAGSRLNTNDAIRREPVPLGVRRSGM